MSEKPIKVMCQRPSCEGIVAHIWGKNMVSIKRSKNLIQTLGNDYAMVVSCPFKDCTARASIVCENGQIKIDKLKILDETNLPINDNKDGKEPKKDEEESDDESGDESGSESGDESGEGNTD